MNKFEVGDIVQYLGCDDPEKDYTEWMGEACVIGEIGKMVECHENGTIGVILNKHPDYTQWVHPDNLALISKVVLEN